MSFALEVSIDAARPLAFLRSGGRRVAYAVVNAINATARAVQEAERARVAAAFTLRNKRAFLLRMAAIIKPFASVPGARYEARISVGQAPRLLLSRFEQGGSRGPIVGHNVAVPLVGGARRSQTSAIAPSLFIQRLGFHRVGGAIQGASGAYVVPRVGVFQRRRGEKRSRMLYSFTPRVALDQRLRFVTTGRAIAARRYPQEMSRQVRDAFEHDLQRLLN